VASAHPAQLPLHRVGIPGPRRGVTRFAVRLRAFRGLWRHHCSDTRVALAAIAATCGWRRHGMDLQSLGLSCSRERFLPGQSLRPVGRAVGSHLFHSDFDCAITAAEFQKVLDRQGIVQNFVTGSLAHLQIDRAYALQGDTANAKSAPIRISSRSGKTPTLKSPS
jgi:hypothetical protein